MGVQLHEDHGKIHQVLVKFLDGKHRTFNFTTPTITVGTLMRKIQILTAIPTDDQLLLHQPTTLLHHDHQTLNLIPSSEPQKGRNFPLVVHLLLRLRGGKGGFGSLLRGAATKAGQKKTNNFDACRDMSGRRLRHVNAEKKLEEWRAEAPERKLERIAEEFIKKKGKEVVKKGKGKGGVDTDKYVDKYRQDSSKCMEEVDRSVRESLKRKDNEQDDKTHAKRFKIWLGKRKLNDSDSEDVDEEDSDEDKNEGDNRSAVTDNGDHSDSSKEADGSSGSVTDIVRDNVSSDAGLSDSASEEEKGTMEEEQQKFASSSPNEAGIGNLSSEEPAVSGSKPEEEGNLSSEEPAVSGSKPEEESSILPHPSDFGEGISQPPSTCSSGEENIIAKVNGDSTSCPAFQDEVVTVVADTSNVKAFSLDEFDSAAELEVLGMERLKSELQARGLKCGGTLQERASRLFLLKTTPLEMIPKKLLAKK